MTNLQKTLEDAAFSVLYEEMYQTINARLDYMVHESEIIIPMISVELQDVVERGGVECSVSGRLKSAYSIWRKMQRKKVTIDQLSDMMAFRVLVPNVADCYRALGSIHAAYPNVMGRFKDYISTPKRNGYQSLHTGVIGPENHKIEIQVRTPEMHSVAEFGVAAHWNYNDPGSEENIGKFKWIQELVGILDEEAGAEEFLEHTKMDLYHDQVFCFTPRGDLIALPKGATAVDFAYAVHSKVGEKCCGVRINGKNRQLATELENGDKIDIITKATARPLAEWENFVKTGRAKVWNSACRASERAVEFSRVGRSILQKSFSEAGKRLQKRTLDKIPQIFGVQKPEDIFALIGEGRMQPQLILEKLYPDLAKSKKRAKALKIIGFQTNSRTFTNHKGYKPRRCYYHGPVLSPFARRGYYWHFTTGKGVTVHRADCANLVDFNDMPELWMNVGWEHEGPGVLWDVSMRFFLMNRGHWLLLQQLSANRVEISQTYILVTETLTFLVSSLI